MAYIVDAVRTPIGKIYKSLSAVTADQLGETVVRVLLERNSLDSSLIDEVVFSNCINFDFGNIARIVSLRSGLPISVPAVCVDRRCSSSLNAIAYASMLVDTGNADIVIAGGTESCSNEPMIVNSNSKENMLVSESTDEIGDPTMIETAENVAHKYCVSRIDCDSFSLKSHKKAIKFYENHYNINEIVPIVINGKTIDSDECIRYDTSIEKLAKLSPLIEGGIVTAGNCTPKNDGASAVLIVSEKYKNIFCDDCFYIEGFASSGCDPNYMGMGPVYSTKKLLKKKNLAIEDFDLIELNEAFAAQAIACARELNIADDKMNVCGGAIAYGHPYAASGGILTARLINEMKRRNFERGLISFCCGGGQGFSMSILRK